MSVINKMLQDLDRRQALGAVAESAIVRPQATRVGRHEWFWRILAVLLALALGWMAWVAWQITPRHLATDSAFRAAAEAQRRTAEAPSPAPKAEPAPEPVALAVAEPPETLRLATQIETPVREPEPEPVKAEPAKPRPAKPKAAAPKVDKQMRARTPTENADAHFRRAALMLSHGRVSEAEAALVAALHADPGHSAARQAYVALLLEQQRVDAARRVLQEALALDPAHPIFALALARIHTEQRNYAGALQVMERAGSVARNADFQALRGAVLQRLSRHEEAVAAFQDAVRGGPQPATTWVGLGISLEAVGRRPEAGQAYRRALSAGAIAPEAREYAERRARALE